MSLPASLPVVQTQPTPGDTSWFTNDRLGLFIHWGLYSLAARHEWVQNNESIPPDEYKKRYFDRFDPDLYDPNQWAQIASDAGMKYVVVGTKHHEGFCLWDSKHTDFKATNTPAGRDLLRPMLDAFRQKGIRVGLYYSLLDWHHDQYIIDNAIGPLRNLPKAERDALNATRDASKYARYVHDQTRELLTNYGQIDVLWYDYSYPHKDHPDDLTLGKNKTAWQSEELYKLVRELQPRIVLNDRLDLPEGWDVKTPEQVQPRIWQKLNGVPVVWEACQTFSGSWGYHRDEQSWRSTEQLIQTLVDVVSKGGNLLLNVGPTGRGEFDDRAMDRLRGIGKWMRRHSRSVYGCTQVPDELGTSAPPDARLTYNPRTHRLYLHLFAYPYKHVHLDGLWGKVQYAQLLHDGSELTLRMDEWHAKQFEHGDTTLTIQLPQLRPDVAVPVVELFLKDR
jgi:alpha-L-fucosidase